MTKKLPQSSKLRQPRGYLIIFLQFIKTSFANLLAFEFSNVFAGITEATARLVSGEDDSITVYEDFYRVSAGEPEFLAYFFWNYDSSEFINVAYNTC